MPPDPREILLALLRTGPLPLAVIDADGRIAAVSAAFQQATGLAHGAAAPSQLASAGVLGATFGERQFDVWTCPAGAYRVVGLQERTEITRLEDQVWEQQTRLTQVYADLTVRNNELVEAMAKAERHEAELAEMNRTLEKKVQEQVDQIERGSRLMRYLSPEIAQAVVKGDGVDLSTHKRVLTVLFADLSAFDDLIAEMESEEIIEVLNEYRKEMTAILFANGGTLDKFLSARVVAFFGDPVPHANHVERAVRTGLQMRERVRSLRGKWSPSASHVDLQVGIHAGYVTVGNVGSESRVDYTVVGKNVALAAALQQEAKPGQVLITARSFEAVKDIFDAHPVEVAFKGSSRPVSAVDVRSQKVGMDPTIVVAAPAAAPPSTQTCDMGPYRIVEKVGQGGMGTVYKAMDDRLQRMVALKVLLPDLAMDERFVTRFKREARTLASLNSPHIAQIYFVSDREVPPFFAMEFVEGPTLKRVIADQGRLPLRRALDLALQMADGLAAAAEQGVIHRDIKPDNVMLTLRGQVKLTDFGLGKTVGTEPGLTSRGMIVGTPLYMSPEQGSGEELDLRSDIYSLGATLFHMLVGEPPFTGPTALVVLRKHLESDLPPLPSLPDTLSPGAYQVLRRMMAKQPKDRYATYEELTRALESC